MNDVTAKSNAKDLKRVVEINENVEISWASANKAKLRIAGLDRYSHNLAWSLIPAYIDRLNEADPGCHAVWAAEGTQMSYAFVASSAARESMRHLRPVISIDGAFSKTWHYYTLCVAACYDAENHIVVLAWGFIPSENEEGWSWWMENLKEAFRR